MLSCTGKRSHRHTILHVSFSNSFGLASARPTPQGLSGAPIYQKNVEKAIRHTSLEKDINKVLKPYNLVVSRITTDWGYDPVSSTLDRYPLHKLTLSLNTPMPKMFIIMPLRVELTTIQGKGPRHLRSYPQF